MLQAYHSVVYSLACYTQVDSVPVTCLRLCAALPVSAKLIDCERCAPGLTAHRDDNEMECRRPPGLRRSQRSSPPGSSGGVGSPASGGSGQLRPSGRQVHVTGGAPRGAGKAWGHGRTREAGVASRNPPEIAVSRAKFPENSEIFENRKIRKIEILKNFRRKIFAKIFLDFFRKNVQKLFFGFLDFWKIFSKKI